MFHFVRFDFNDYPDIYNLFIILFFIINISFLISLDMFFWKKKKKNELKLALETFFLLEPFEQIKKFPIDLELKAITL